MYLPTAYVGFDCRMPDAYMVAARSILDRSTSPIAIKPLLLPHLRACRAYMRPTKLERGIMIDEISEAPMSTQFSISRFLIPALEQYKGWALFCDSDFLFMADPIELFKNLDPRKALYCVQHRHNPTEMWKMDGQMQTRYERKNWSSLMLINCAHPSNRWLNLENVNSATGRDLHRFCWLEDDEIGALDEAWNWLEGHSDIAIKPKAVHYTRGTPDMQGFENIPYADEWRAALGKV